MTDSLWACPACGRTSSQPPNVTAVTCFQHEPAVEMEEQDVDKE